MCGIYRLVYVVVFLGLFGEVILFFSCARFYACPDWVSVFIYHARKKRKSHMIRCESGARLPYSPKVSKGAK